MALLWGIEAALLVSCWVLLIWMMDGLSRHLIDAPRAAWYGWALGVGCGTAWLLGLLLVTAP